MVVKTDLTAGPIHRHLITLSVPMIWGILSIISMQVADLYFIGRLGQTELEAISFTFPVNMTLFHLIIGLSIATSSITARLIGQRHTNELKQFLFHALVIGFLIGLGLAVLGTLFINPVFSLLGAPREAMPLITPYMAITLWGSAFLTVPMIGNAALRAGGDTLTPATIMVLAALINVFLDWILIFGHWGAPAMGVNGAATATVTANFCAMLAGLYFLVCRKKMLDRSHVQLKQIGHSMRRLMAIAAPVGIANLITPLTTAVLTALLATSGTMAVAAFGIVGRVEALAAVIIMALATGMSPIIGQNFGAKKFDRVEETLRQAILFCVVWSLAMALVLIFFSGTIGGAFSSHPETIQIAAFYFLIVAPTAAIGNIINGWASAWSAMGKPKTTLILMSSKAIVGSILPAFIGNMIAGWQGIFVGLALGNLIIGLSLHFYSRKIWRQTIRRAHAALAEA